MTTNVDLLKKTQTLYELDGSDGSSTFDDMNDMGSLRELKEIELAVKDTIEKPNQTGLRKFLEDILTNRSQNETERNLTADALVSLYYSVETSFESLNKTFTKNWLSRLALGKRYKKFLKEREVALKREILALLGQYGIRVFCDTSMFDGRWHTIARTKPTNRKKLDRQIAKVVREGFVRQRREGSVLFRPQVVDVYKYKGSCWV